MLFPEQARMACEVAHREARSQADQHRLVAAARLQRRAGRKSARAERAVRRADQAAAEARLAWVSLV